MRKSQQNNILIAIKIGLIVNLFLAFIKLFFGYLGNAQALLSDGLNSLSDVLISILLLIILSISTKKPDDNHPYGHEKFEGIAYFLLGVIFIITSLFIEINGVLSLIRYFSLDQETIIPNIYTVYVSSLSLVIKFFLFYYFFKVSKKYQSLALKADSKNHFIDVIATLISLLGLILSQFNLVIFDYISSMIIGLFILKLAISILKDSVSYLVDQAPSIKEVEEIYKFIEDIQGVLSIDDLKVRKHMTKKYVDVEIGVDSKLTLAKAHKIAENVHEKVEEKFLDVIHCMVHVNPIHHK